MEVGALLTYFFLFEDMEMNASNGCCRCVYKRGIEQTLVKRGAVCSEQNEIEERGTNFI